MPNMIIDGRTVAYESERNLLEIIRAAGIDLPTFCYQPELSVYGACRMCMVEVEGRGILPACSTSPAPDLVVKTNTKEIREMRKMIVELMLASHDRNCLTCPKSTDCKLQKVARDMGITDVRFKQVNELHPIDRSSKSIVRDPSKCVLCGNCVRTCRETQGVGVIDFANRGANAIVTTPFNEDIGKLGTGRNECINCGQCVKVCPVGALTIQSDIHKAQAAIDDPTKTVVVQIAPSVRVAIGDAFGLETGTVVTPKLVAALRGLGFDQVYDTCFGADFTVVEEGSEFLKLVEAGGPFPMFTSCCPAWVKYAEQNYPDLLGNLSTCSSPQAMFSALVKEQLPAKINKERKDVVIVSIMPCTAKKFEAAREQHTFTDGIPATDIVLTTAELAVWIQESGLNFKTLPDEEFDQPFGTFSGGAVIFGASGGVSEAVLRFAADHLKPGSSKDAYTEVRGSGGLVETSVDVGGKTLRLAVVSGLAHAKELVEKIRAGEVQYDIVEVMACLGGCVNGGGQPIHYSAETAIRQRAKGLYKNDTELDTHISSHNPALKAIYNGGLDAHHAHELLHTSYEARPRVAE